MRVAFQMLLLICVARESVRAGQGEQDWAFEAGEVPAKHTMDADWADYVHTLADAYDEDATDQTSSSHRYNFDPLDWAPLKYGEVPFLAVLYKKDTEGPSDQYKNFFPGESDPGLGHIEPGKACGGAIITRSELISVCGCIMTFASRIFDSKQFDTLFPKRLIPYDMDSKNDKYRIYMTHSIIQFRPDFAHQIDAEKGWKHPSMPPTLNCLKMFQEALSLNDETKSAKANSQVVLARFKPDIGHPLSGQFPNWPPPAFDYLIDSDIIYTRINLVSIGMRMTTYTKYRFQSSIQASSLVSKLCYQVNPLPLNCNKKNASFINARKYVCLCPAYGNKYRLQLIGGVIGWPIIYPNGSLVGLSVTDRNSADGGFLVSWLASDVVHDLQGYITQEVLLGQNNLTKTYRERDLDRRFNIYDYGFGPGPPKPKGSASIFGPPVFTINVLILMCPFWGHHV